MRAPLLVHCRRGLQIDLLPLSLNNSRPDLGGGFALLMLLVRVIKLFQAGRALRSMGVFKTAVQAVVAHAIAIAVARLLMENSGNLRRQFIRVSLIGILRVRTPEVRLG